MKLNSDVSVVSVWNSRKIIFPSSSTIVREEIPHDLD